MSTHSQNIRLDHVIIMDGNEAHWLNFTKFIHKNFPDAKISIIDPTKSALPDRSYDWQNYDLLMISLHDRREELKNWYQGLIGVRPPAIFIDDFYDVDEGYEISNYGVVDYIAKHKLKPTRLMAAILTTRGDRLLEAATEEIPVLALNDLLQSENKEGPDLDSLQEETEIPTGEDLKSYLTGRLPPGLHDKTIDFESDHSSQSDSNSSGPFNIINILQDSPEPQNDHDYEDPDATTPADHILSQNNESKEDDDATMVAPHIGHAVSDSSAEHVEMDNDATMIASHIANPDESKSFDFQKSTSMSSHDQNDLQRFWPFTMDDINSGKARINYYQVVDLIGVGGMSAVFKVMRERDGDISAMKILNISMLEDETIKDRFLLEFKIGKAIQNEHLIKIYAQGFEGDIAYIVMELLDGISLKDKIKRRMISPKLAIRYIRQIALALGELHTNDIVHRDLKPANIMFRGDGSLVVADFGISKVINQQQSNALTREGEMVGTPYYVSPEQALGHPLDVRSDLYALGLILYEMFRGKHPYSGKKAMEVMMAHVKGPVPQLDEEYHYLNDILNNLLAKNPDERYENTQALLDDLDKL